MTWYAAYQLSANSWKILLFIDLWPFAAFDSYHKLLVRFVARRSLDAWKFQASI